MSSFLIIVSILYLAFLFGVAYWAELQTEKGKSVVNSSLIYSLSLAVYCTAWTFYGSVGRASTYGLEFLTIYLGPTLMMPLYWLVIRKIIRICKVQRITSIADFISSRYGKNRSLGVIVTVISLFAGIPYISLQLKAVSSSFAIMAASSLSLKTYFLTDQAFYIAILLSIFTILFGTRKIEATERHEGMVMAIAFESLVKLFAFLAVGIYVTYYIFDGFGDIFSRANQVPHLRKALTLPEKEGGYSTWFWHSILSMSAIMFLPRQFQTTVVENVNEKHLNRAMWLFPLYMLLINIFVLPLALGGGLLLKLQNVSADNYVLAIPLLFNNKLIALFTYIGGFSAATSMIIVETIAISLMVSNNLVMPILLGNEQFLETIGKKPARFIQNIRRVSIVVIIFLAYFYYKYFAESYTLVSIGLIAFAAVAQFTPSVIGGIFWKRGSQKGAIIGLLAGISVWIYTLIIPSIVGAGFLPKDLVEQGLFGISLLKPQELFGLTGMDNISHTMFWSMFFNCGSYFFFSLLSNQGSLEHNQAVLFVDIFKYSKIYESSVVWKGTALITDINTLLTSFLGKSRTDRVIRLFANKNNINLKTQNADPKLVNYAEKLLAGIVGTASARMMVASVAKEEKISVDEVVDILKKSQELIAVNKELQRKSKELKDMTDKLQSANQKLIKIDGQKDDFLSTVTHEIRTPMTSIKALTEILYDNPDLNFEEKQHFLNTIIKETDRLSRLINQVLDLEKFDSGKLKISKSKVKINEIIQDAVDSLRQLAVEKHIKLDLILDKNLPKIEGDQDRLMQVMVNLISNSIKFIENKKGEIKITAYLEDENIHINVIDNGIGISPEYHKLIFDKFYQAHDQTIRKPRGSGLGLAISRKIIELHNGKIWVESELNKGSKFSIILPYETEEKETSIYTNIFM